MRRNDFTIEVRCKAKVTLNRVCFKTNCWVAENGTHQWGGRCRGVGPWAHRAGLTGMWHRHKLRLGRQSQQEWQHSWFWATSNGEHILDNRRRFYWTEKLSSWDLWITWLVFFSLPVHWSSLHKPFGRRPSAILHFLLNPGRHLGTRRETW